MAAYRSLRGGAGEPQFYTVGSGGTTTAASVCICLTSDRTPLARIWAQRGQYENARAALESAIASNPDYAIAHENLGDIYSRLAGAEYDRALALDKSNKSAQAKLVLVRQLYAVPPSSNAPKLGVPVPKPAAPPKAKK